MEWQMVTVACSCRSSMAAGLPTISLRPTMTARCPAMGMPPRFKQLDNSGGRAGSRRGQPDDQGADIAGMETIDVLGGRDGHQDALGIDLRRQGQLHQDAVDVGARVQRLDDRQQFRGGNGVGRRDGFGVNPQVVAGLDFVANVDFRSGIVADQDDGQPGRTALGGERIDARLQFALDVIAYAISVEDSRHSSQS